MPFILRLLSVDLIPTRRTAVDAIAGGSVLDCSFCHGACLQAFVRVRVSTWLNLEYTNVAPFNERHRQSGAGTHYAYLYQHDVQPSMRWQY